MLIGPLVTVTEQCGSSSVTLMFRKGTAPSGAMQTGRTGATPPSMNPSRGAVTLPAGQTPRETGVAVRRSVVPRRDPQRIGASDEDECA